jgi:hypothetical protein
MSTIEIDYSEISQPASEVLQEDWEPPVHKYFGKKDSKGKMEKEPIYSYVEFPRILYGMREGKIFARVVNNTGEKEALMEKGFVLNPIEFGLITAPSFEQRLEQEDTARKAKEAATADVGGTADPAPDAPRRPGRPPKA